jgi:predicted ATPase
MAADPERFTVITGGPGSGKTTLIEALARRGHGVTVEAGRDVIRAEVAAGGTALPWADRAGFAERMLAHELASYAAAGEREGLVFFDRGAPDVVGYLRLCSLPVAWHVDAAARRTRYAPRVFIAPPWPEIFAQDAERRQTLDEAVATFDIMVGTYRAYGYELVELPLAPVENRVDFVLNGRV